VEASEGAIKGAKALLEMALWTPGVKLLANRQIWLDAWTRRPGFGWSSDGRNHMIYCARKF
jgi:hypothetical protein